MSDTNQAQELNAKQAINVLIQAARIGQSKGAFSLEDAALIMNAIKVFLPEESVEGEDPVLNTEKTAETPA